MTASLKKDGYYLEDGFLSESECRDLLDKIAAYRSAFEVPKIYRDSPERPLNYSVIDGLQIKRHLPEIHLQLERIKSFTGGLTGEALVPLNNEKVACNINITGPGGSYRWHYDRNRYTALIYLNEVEGGQTEMYPHYRLKLGRSRGSRLQRAADAALRSRQVRSVFGDHKVIDPETGRLLVMKGDTCLHSVRPVTSEHDRINIVLSYDIPGTQYEVARGLDSYLYTEAQPVTSDPNYIG